MILGQSYNVTHDNLTTDLL